MIDPLLRTAGHWSDTDVRHNLIHQVARILGARGPEVWLEATERLRLGLHFAPGILEHQTIAESMSRDRNPAAYAQARIDEMNDEARKPATMRDPQSPPSAERTAAGDQRVHRSRPDPSGPSR